MFEQEYSSELFDDDDFQDSDLNELEFVEAEHQKRTKPRPREEREE